MAGLADNPKPKADYYQQPPDKLKLIDSHDTMIAGLIKTASIILERLGTKNAEYSQL